MHKINEVFDDILEGTIFSSIFSVSVSTDVTISSISSTTDTKTSKLIKCNYYTFNIILPAPAVENFKMGLAFDHP